MVRVKSRSTRVSLLAVSCMLLALVLYSVMLGKQGGTTAPTAIHGLLAAIAVVALLGAVAPRSTWRLGLLAAAATAAYLLGLIAIWSIGLLVVFGAALATGWYALVLASSDAPERRLRAGLASVVGCLAGVALVATAMLPSMSPRVDCLPHGARFTSGWSLFGGRQTGGGTMSGGANSSTITGTSISNGQAYHFTCRDGRLVQFTRVADPPGRP